MGVKKIYTYICIYIWEIMANNFPILVKDINLHIQETQKPLEKTFLKSTPKHTLDISENGQTVENQR